MAVLIRGVLVTLCCLFLLPQAGFSQQVLQRGALGRPSQVLDETEQWTTPLLTAGDKEVEIYIPDVSNAVWLQRNYPDFWDKKQYVISMFTFYRTPRACRANQIAWGFADQAHLDACIDIGYRVRQTSVDAQQKTVTLIMAGMVTQDGQLIQDSVQQQSISRTWAQLDPNTQTALQKTTELVADQMRAYDRRVRGQRQIP
jgi:hypothetical protein